MPSLSLPFQRGFCGLHPFVESLQSLVAHSSANGVTLKTGQAARTSSAHIDEPESGPTRGVGNRLAELQRLPEVVASVQLLECDEYTPRRFRYHHVINPDRWLQPELHFLPIEERGRIRELSFRILKQVLAKSRFFLPQRRHFADHGRKFLSGIRGLILI